MTRDLRKYSKQTNFRLLVGFFVLLLIGDGLIYFIYGKGAAIFGMFCLLIGLAPLNFNLGNSFYYGAGREESQSRRRSNQQIIRGRGLNLNEFETHKLADWHLRVRAPIGQPPHPVALLLHGLTGDENVMGIFASQLPAAYLVISPRGLYRLPGGGYSWIEKDFGAWPGMEHFQGT